MSIRWIRPNLGTSAAASCRTQTDVFLLDVRDLVDKSGNSSDLVREKIRAGLEALRSGKRLVVCCDYGISRSNAIAAGILAQWDHCRVDEAAREVIAATGEAEIKLELLDAVRTAVDAAAGHPARPECATARVLVTGSNGFLGKSVVARLQALGREVVAPPRAELDLAQGRAQLDMLIRERGVTQVLHLANPRVYTSNLALGETLSMLRNVLEVCARTGMHLVYPSSWEVYSGYRTACLHADESLPMFPRGPYGETKFLCESLITHFRRTADLQCGLLRLSPIYGPGGDRPRFIHTFAEKAHRGEQIVTHRYANGYPALDLLHVSDATEALCKAVAARYVGDLNVGTGTLTATRQIAEWIADWSGAGARVESVSVAGDAACIAMDGARARTQIGWEPTVPVQDGLRDMIQAAARKAGT